MHRATPFVVVAAVSLAAAPAPAQNYRIAGGDFTALRRVFLPAEPPHAVAVVEFLHHGQIDAEGGNLLVAAQGREPVAHRVLQLGPGDFCRLAFEVPRGQTRFEIYYGGPPPVADPPEWSNTDGLLLEVRRYRECNLDSLESVRAAFDEAEPIGADYVDGVHHAFNPMTLERTAFLSRYRGRFEAPAGRYGFFTSSRDASFLLVDGEQVVAAPGRRQPLRQARPETRGTAELAGGSHRFEYYHAAAGPEAMMMAAWERSPGEPPEPEVIPPERFGADRVVRAEPGPVERRAARGGPDFDFLVAGDVPLPDNELALVGVAFRNRAPPAAVGGGRVTWDFGDGQTSSELNPVHVYLRPGMYTVRFEVRRGASRLEIANRIHVGRPYLTPGDPQHQLDDYLPILETYDPRQLDASSLRQLVLAYETKYEALMAAEPSAEEEGAPTDEAARRNEGRRYLERAVAAGREGLVEGSPAGTDDDILALTRLVAPLARYHLGDSRTAYEVWRAAARRLEEAEPKAEAELAAAEIAIHDAVNPAVAGPLLEAAGKRLADIRSGALASRLQRVWGDRYAAGGEGEKARAAYLEAAARRASTRPYVEGAAWRGAYSRSTEEFLQEGSWERAGAELERWQDEFPTEKIDGHLTFLYARYWMGRGQHAQAVAQAEQLLAVNPDSPYADRILLVAAEAEAARGRTDRARAALESILADYPGSPLLDEVRRRITELGSGR